MKKKLICKNCKNQFIDGKWYKNSKRTYCSQLCHYISRPNGEKHFNWRGGRSKHTQGYINVSINKERKLEHRLIMESYLGRKLLSEEIVHHIDGDKTNNCLENLEILNRASHCILHNPAKGRIVSIATAKG